MDFSSFKIVRLNAELFPITSFEEEKYDEHGMTPVGVPQAAEALGISTRSAERLWTYSRAWLLREIRGDNSPQPTAE